jgi:hypothetical protein
MSINALSNAAVARRADFEPAGRVPMSIGEIGLAAATAPTPVDAAGGTPPAPQANGGPTATLQTLTTYIPTEVLTLYVSAVAALGSVKNTQGQDIGRWIPFWCFLVITPGMVWLAFAAKVQAAGKALPTSPAKWPVWEMAAATLAYVAWVFALPNTPFARYAQYSTGLAGFLILIVSWGLGAVAPLMQRQLPH